MNAKCDLLVQYAEECEQYASDNEERELAETTKCDVRGFKMGVSIEQTESVTEKLAKLENVNKQFASALNKDTMKEVAFRLIGDLERQFARMNETIENGWDSLQKKYHHFQDFDLKNKHGRLTQRHAKCETATAQIKDKIASLLLRILEKLDSNISKEDRESLKVIQKETQKFQIEIQKYLNNNVELGRELANLNTQIPTMTLQVKDLDHFNSLESQFKAMSAFSEKLKQQELRMQIIKDKIDVFDS